MAGNTIRTAESTNNIASQEIQVTGTDFEGGTKRGLDVNILGGNLGQGSSMKCERGIIDLEKNVTQDIITSMFQSDICSIEFFDNSMRKILVAYRIMGTNTFRICPTVDKESVTWKAQGV